jgi:hypothetical protein
MEIVSEKTVKEWTRDGSLCQDEDFERMGVFGGKTDRGREFVVEFMNVLVQRAPV